MLEYIKIWSPEQDRCWPPFHHLASWRLTERSNVPGMIIFGHGGKELTAKMHCHIKQYKFLIKLRINDISLKMFDQNNKRSRF